MVKRAILRGGNHIGGIDAKHIECKTGTKTEVLTIAGKFTFVEVAAAEEELLIVGIFRTERIVDALKGIFVERIEDTGNRGFVFPFLESNFIRLLVVVFRQTRFGRHEQFIGIHRECEIVVISQRECKRRTDTQIGGQESRVVAVVVRHLRAHIREVPTPRPLTLIASDNRIGGKVARDVGSKRRCALIAFGGRIFGIAEVAINVAQSHTHREFLAQFTRIAQVDRHFKWVDAPDSGATFFTALDFTQREIAQRRTHGLVVAATQFPIASHISQENVVHNFAQPRRVAQRHTGRTFSEGIFRSIPELGVHIGVGSHTQITHRSTACIGSDANRAHTGGDRVEILFFNIAILRLSGESTRGQQG